MAKTLPLDSTDLAPASKERRASTSRTRQRGVVPSADLVPMQFRMPADFVKAFKREALERDMKLNELLNTCFNELKKKSK